MLVRHWKLRTLPPPFFYPPLTHHPQTLAYLNGSPVLHWIWKCFSTFLCSLMLSCTQSLSLFSPPSCSSDRKREREEEIEKRRWRKWEEGGLRIHLQLPATPPPSVRHQYSEPLLHSTVVFTDSNASSSGMRRQDTQFSAMWSNIFNVNAMRKWRKTCDVCLWNPVNNVDVLHLYLNRMEIIISIILIVITNTIIKYYSYLKKTLVIFFSKRLYICFFLKDFYFILIIFSSQIEPSPGWCRCSRLMSLGRQTKNCEERK